MFWFLSFCLLEHTHFQFDSRWSHLDWHLKFLSVYWVVCIHHCCLVIVELPPRLSHFLNPLYLHFPGRNDTEDYLVIVLLRQGFQSRKLSIHNRHLPGMNDTKYCLEVVVVVYSLQRFLDVQYHWLHCYKFYLPFFLPCLCFEHDFSS